MKKRHIVFLTIFSLFSTVEYLASTPEQQVSKIEHDGMQSLQCPHVIKPVKDDEQRMKELLSRTAFVKEHDFVWLEVQDVDDGGIKLWAITEENVLKASAPIYFPGVYKFFISNDDPVPLEKMDPNIFRQW